MIAQIPPEIVSAIPSKWLVYATAAWVFIQSLGRIFQAIKSGGGLVSIWQGLLYGTNAKTDKQETATEVKIENKTNV